MTLLDLPNVSTCSVAGCSFNHDGCHAPAVTIDGDEGCATFIPLDRKGGLDKVIAGVGACQAADCRFNKDLTCSAPAIRVGAQGSGAADCLTYEAA